MKKITSKALYTYANAILAKSEHLALLNCIYEIRNGSLVAEVIEGEPLAAEAADTKCLVAYGCGVLNEKAKIFATIFEDVEDAKSLLIEAGGQIENLPQPIDIEKKEELRIAGLPSTLAALAVCEDASGRRSYVLFQHPLVDRDRAITILKTVLLRIRQDSAKPVTEKENN